MEKIFLSKYSTIKLQVGDFVEERNRFNKQWVLFRIDKIDESGCGCKMTIIGTSGWGKVGNTVGGDIRCFYGGQNSAYLCYYIPAGRVLFGNATTKTT